VRKTSFGFYFFKPLCVVCARRLCVVAGLSSTPYLSRSISASYSLSFIIVSSICVRRAFIIIIIVCHDNGSFLYYITITCVICFPTTVQSVRGIKRVYYYSQYHNAIIVTTQTRTSDTAYRVLVLFAVLRQSTTFINDHFLAYTR